MDGLCEQCLAGTGLSDDHEGLSIVGEVRDSRLESGDGGAAAYDLDGIQSSGPGVRGQMEVSNVGRKENGGSQLEVSWTQKVSGTRKVDYLEGIRSRQGLRSRITLVFALRGC